MGKTGLQLSVLSYGSWVTFYRQVDENASDRLLSLAYDSGINFFDNAEGYENGRSETLMGKVISKKGWDRSSYCLSSKVYFGTFGKENRPNQTGLSRKHLIEGCHGALKRLKTEYLDIYYCHRPDPNVPMEEIVRAMNILLQQGKIFYWGTSEWSADAITEAQEIANELHMVGPDVEQPQYNLFERQKMEHDYLSLFENGMGSTIWSPLASGLLTGKYNKGVPAGSRLALENYAWLKERVIQEDKIEKVKKLEAIARDMDTSVATLSIAWCISNPNVTSAILGATKEAQLQENLGALAIYPLLTPERKSEINAIMAA